MLPNRSPYQSSSLRVTKHEANYLKLNEQILGVIAKLTAPKNAEEIWFELKNQGVLISIATFHVRLKKLVGAGEVEKREMGYNKYEYQIA